MWPFTKKSKDTVCHDQSKWVGYGGFDQDCNSQRFTKCLGCGWHWATYGEPTPCTCTLPRQALSEPYPGYGLFPRHGRNVMPPPAPAAPSRNPIPQPDPERRSRPRGDRTSNQVPPYPLPPSPRPATPRELEAEAASRLVAAEAYRLNTTGSVAVATDTYWNEDMTTCPRGAKVQLLGAGGVAAYGSYHGDPFWVGWAPVPRRRP